MSSIFSDPPFRRGSTLLGGEVIELDAAGKPVAGRDVIGAVKAFQDVLPTGLGTRLSNRLVYCVAARYTGSTTLEGSAVAGRVVSFADAAPLSEWTGAYAAEADIAAGKPCGVIDEYLTNMQIRPNDIIWLVVSGPTTMVKENSSAVASGSPVEIAAGTGRVSPQSTGTPIGQSIVATSVTGSAGTTIRVNKINNYACI